MLIDVRPILHTPGQETALSSLTLDLSDLEFGGRYPGQPACRLWRASVRNTRRCAGAGADGPDHAGRCVRPLRQGFSSGEGNPVRAACWRRSSRMRTTMRSFCWRTERWMWASWRRTAFILGMDTKTLCSEDCKGLCPRCGADLNLGPCSCKKEVDPASGGSGQAFGEQIK